MDKNMTLEQANNLLEETVKKLENNALPISESVALYTEACELLAFCMNELSVCKGKIDEANDMLAKRISEEGNE